MKKLIKENMWNKTRLTSLYREVFLVKFKICSRQYCYDEFINKIKMTTKKYQKRGVCMNHIIEKRH